MKRAGNLFSEITDRNNFRLAYLKALKGKRNKASVIYFSKQSDVKLEQLRKLLIENSYTVSPYRQFKIYDPKERTITAAAFEDRIIHHAIMNVLEPVFERQFIFHTYACRKGKGVHSAVKALKSVCNTNRYYLKLDVKKYFDSISHEVLKSNLKHIIKDKQCLNLLFLIIDSYSVDCFDSKVTKRGLPIGNLTSQFFANFYLSGLDHFILEELKPLFYCRYMDDMILLSDSIGHLKKMYSEIENFCREKLLLRLKIPVINACVNGIAFLGRTVRSNTHLSFTKKYFIKQE